MANRANCANARRHRKRQPDGISTKEPRAVAAANYQRDNHLLRPVLTGDQCLPIRDCRARLYYGYTAETVRNEARSNS